ncbi:haloacid dehalogenase type II [Halegenticoccus tardaugens]|uniref:haloacid dehalogenase type II n=1 Tax=Halegenticoccus tardaugens TaxID=2071624 RepID=UPI00100B4259|nr:haloacid dehalogenase type II [Halegenticoccus tardaugens]
MPEALCFDMYGTLCDTQAVTATLRENVDAPDPLVGEIARTWRDRQLEYMFRAVAMDAYRPLTEVTSDALAYALDYYGRGLTDDEIGAVMAAYRELDPFDETLDALAALGESGLDTAVFSNGNREMLEPLAANVGIDEHVDEIVSADEAGTYKPDPAAYEHAADRLGREIDECWLVSSNVWDVVGATEAGMGAAWVNRSNEPYDPFAPDPNAVVRSLSELVEEI